MNEETSEGTRDCVVFGFFCNCLAPKSQGDQVASAVQMLIIIITILSECLEQNLIKSRNVYI